MFFLALIVTFLSLSAGAIWREPILVLHSNQLIPTFMQSIPWSWELLSSCNSSSKFLCKHMPLNFRIKVILFQNYHVYTPDRSAVTGRESWSGVYCFVTVYVSLWAHASKLLREHHCFTGTWIHLSRPAIKCLSDPGESNSTIQPCFSSICLLECF